MQVSLARLIHSEIGKELGRLEQQEKDVATNSTAAVIIDLPCLSCLSYTRYQT